MALAGAVLVYVVIHVIFITLDENTSRRSKEEGDELVEKTRKRLLLFAILAATITYQAGLTPPGGFLLQDDQSGHHAGDPILLYNFPRRYKAFFYCNTVSYMLSIALILLLVNPNLYRPAIRSHALSVCTAAGLFGLLGAYAAGSTQHLKTSIYTFVLVAVVIFFIGLLFLVFFFVGSSGAQPAAPTPGDNNTTQEQAMEAAKKKKEKNEEHDMHAKRKYLMLLGILVASVTYQAGLAPPGRAWQSGGDGHEAGNPVMHDNRRPRYLAFFYSNSTSFMASIVVILLLLLPKNILVKDTELKRWHFVMNTTIVLDLLGLLGAYAAGSNRGLKTSVYVFVLVIAVAAYMAIHLFFSRISKRKQRADDAET
jgi:flagellar basal body-associated protein FliL